MAMSFGPDTPVLSYGPRAHADPGGRNDREWLLWPARAFRVVAPELRPRGVNLLQKAVLGVLRASRLTAAELGRRLGVHPELAAFVVTELQTQGRVDDAWTVTRRGVEVLEEEHDQSTELAPGWVFRDPWSGSLWPFVAASLEYAPTELDERGYPVLMLGKTGRPWLQSAWMQLPPGGRSGELSDGASGAAEPPDAREILRAVHRHKRRAQRSRRLGEWENEDDDTEGTAVSGLDFNRISVIEPEPEPVFLVSYLYVPRDGYDADWHACDFFGRGSDPALRRLVVRVADDEREPRLARRLNRLLGRTPHCDFDTFRRAARGWESCARRLAEWALTMNVHHYGVVEPLTETLEGWLEMRDLGDAAGPRHWRNVLTSCRRTLERLFRDVAKAWPLAGVEEGLSRHDRKVNEEVPPMVNQKKQPNVNQEKLRASAVDVGFAGDAVPEALCNVRYGLVRSVSKYTDSSRLRPLVAATLLRASTEEHHPLRSAARKAPNLLSRIERVTKRGGEAAHDNVGGQFDIDSATTSVKDTLAIVGLLLDLPVRPMDEALKEIRNGKE